MLVTVASELRMVIVMSALRIGVIRMKNKEKYAFNIAVGAVRDWIGVMNSEKKYRHTLEPSRDPTEPKGTLCCYGRASA